MKRGFTLIEMLAVIVIISLISVVTVPAIINQISSKKTEIDTTTKQMIYEATELYMKNDEVSYPRLTNNKYTVSLDKLVTAGLLQSPIKDYTTGNDIPLTKCVQTTVNSYKEYDNFTIIDKC